MASLRLCSHIKTNGVKCGSPALRHHTMCYFHYQWQRRDQRRIRLGGPVGMNKNSGIELPLLDGPEAVLVSIMEIQHALLDQRIPIKMGTALLYSLQLALQAKIPYSGLCAREPVRECPELEMDLELERAKSLRPSKEKCSACPKQETCLSPRGCKKLPKLPAGYRREGDRLIRDNPEPASTAGAPFKLRRSAGVQPAAEIPRNEGPASFGLSGVVLGNENALGAPFFAPASGAKGGAIPDDTTDSSSPAESREPGSSAACCWGGSDVVEGPASGSSVHPIIGSSVASVCHPERSAAVSRVAEGPFVSSPEATALELTPLSETSTPSPREPSPGPEPGEVDRKFRPSRIAAPHLPQLADVGSAHARRQVQLGTENRELGTCPMENGEQRSSYSHNILGSNPNALIDLPEKFPQLTETTGAENHGVG